MTVISKPVRAALAAAMLIDLATFSGISVLKLIGFSAGMALVFLGLLYSYRQPAAAGLVIVSATAAASVELTTLLEIRTLLIATVGLLLPISILTWISLESKDEEPVDEALAKRPMLFSAIYGALCLLSILAVLLVISLFNPGLSLRATTMTEAAIMLIAAIAGGAFVALRGPAQGTE